MSEHTEWYLAERVVEPVGYKVLSRHPDYPEDESMEVEIADTYEPIEGSEASRHARLIAAAPELLEALKDYVRADAEGYPGSLGPPKSQEYERACAAIAKAEGRNDV